MSVEYRMKKSKLQFLYLPIFNVAYLQTKSPKGKELISDYIDPL